MFADAVAEFLGLIFEAKTFASQTLGFLRGSAQEGHQDSAYPGSHRFDDFIYKDHYKSVHEAHRMTGESPAREQIERHVHSLEERAAQRGIPKMPFAAKKGDVLVWHADLVHGGKSGLARHHAQEHRDALLSEAPLAAVLRAHGDQTLGPPRAPLHHQPLRRRTAAMTPTTAA